MNTTCLICLTWLTLSFSALSEESPADAVRQRFTEEPFAAGKIQPAPQAKLEILLDKTTWEIGEPLWAKLKISTTAADFSIEHGGDFRFCGYPRRCKVIAIDLKGNVMPDHGFDLKMGGLGGGETITKDKPYLFEFPILDTVNFKTPGEYQIFISHDLGWKTNDDHPVVSAKIKLIEPTADSASKRVKDLLAKIKNTGADIDTQRTSFRATKDIKWLRHPVYLPELTIAAENGDIAAAQAIGGISSIEALQTLIQLIDSEYSDAALKAAGIIEMSGPGSFDLDFEYWDNSLYKPAIEAAERLLGQTGDNEKLIAGSGIINQHGTAKDMAIILEALEDSFDSPGVCYQLTRTIGTLIDRGYRTSDWSSNSHPAAGFVQVNKAWRYQAFEEARKTFTIQKKVLDGIDIPSIPMPEGEQWKKAILSVSDSAPTLIRKLAIAAIPPSESGFDEWLIGSLADKDETVALQACDKIRMTKDSKYIPYLNRITEYTNNPKVIRAAIATAERLAPE